MLLTDFTTFDDIRAALGVSPDELEDTTLSLDVYVFGLMSDFDDLAASPLEAYDGLREADPESMTDAEARFFRAMRLFCTYSVANNLLPALPMFGPKEISDGKASTVRFSSDPYKETTKRVESQFEKAKQRLNDALALLNSQAVSASVVRTYFAGVPAGSDPVTGT